MIRTCELILCNVWCSSSPNLHYKLFSSCNETENVLFQDLLVIGIYVHILYQGTKEILCLYKLMHLCRYLLHIKNNSFFIYVFGKTCKLLLWVVKQLFVWTTQQYLVSQYIWSKSHLQTTFFLSNVPSRNI